MNTKIILHYLPDRQYIHFGKALLLCTLLALSCAKKPTEPEQDNPIRTDTQLKVTKYLLPKGETQEFPAGFEIIASEGIEIAGDLIIKPSRPGDFTLRAENGNINITGKVIVQDTGTPASTGKKMIRGSKALKKETAQQGTGLFFILDRPGAVISIGRGAQIQSGNGRNAQDELIVISQGRYVGGVGAPGGDIIIRAHGGKIILANLQAGDAPLFILGNGGNGANVGVGANFETSGPNLELIGGRGGDSGILFLEADTIEGIPTVEELNIEAELLAGGAGGRGGYVFWYPAEGKTYPLQEIVFQGGNGGNGAVEGGRGGLTVYWSLGPINEIGAPIASVSVTGGNGGKVFASPVPIALAQGGDGGESMVIGNDGWNGVPPDSGGPINGADGGDVNVRGGNGGDVLEEVMFQSAIGGNGAMDEPSLTLRRLIQELGIELLFQTWVISGSGGDGASSCDGCPGGNGGNSGDIQAYGGDGGNVPNRVGARGGQGGDVWQVKRGLFRPGMGKGGNGNQSGEGGCPGSIVVVPGIGGSGYLAGEDGRLLGELPDDDCASDGQPCGEGLTCDDDSTGGKPCWEQIGSTYSAYYEKSTVSTSTVDGSTWTYFESWAENGTLIRPTPHGGLDWQIEGTRVQIFRTPDGVGGDRDTSYSYVPLFMHLGHAVASTWSPQCWHCKVGDEYVLYIPGTDFEYTCESFSPGFISTTTYKLKFIGCNPNPILRNNPGGWRCCKNRAIPDNEDCP